MTLFNRIGDAMSTVLSQAFEATSARSPASKTPRRDGSPREAFGSHVKAEMGKIEAVAREAKQDTDSEDELFGYYFAEDELFGYYFAEDAGSLVRAHLLTIAST